MKKIFVQWGYTDDYGRACRSDASRTVFNTIEEAKDFIAAMRKGNGGYFKIWEVTEGDYDLYERIDTLYKEYLELKNRFETTLQKVTI